MGRNSKEDSATDSGDYTTKSGTDIETDTNDEDESPPPHDTSPYSDGEKVLAYHSLQIYEAQIKKVEFRMNEWKYHLHYLGWNKSWDETVGVDRLLKITEENVQKQQALKLQAEKTLKVGRGSQIKPKSSTVGRGKKRKNDSFAKEKGSAPLDKLISIHIPLALKKQLVDDYEFITHLGKLIKLPRTPNVDDICKKYLDYRSKKDGMIADSVDEIMKGLCCYFDKALPVMLLYKSERQQYEEATADGASPLIVFGAEHLLRLFVKLPEFLFYANIEKQTLAELQKIFADFLKFLQKNRSAFFLSTYHVPEDIEASTNEQEG